MRSVKDTSKVFVVLAALGLVLAGCEQRGADTSGDAGTSGTTASGSMPAGGSGDAGTAGGTSDDRVVQDGAGSNGTAGGLGSGTGAPAGSGTGTSGSGQ